MSSNMEDHETSVDNMIAQDTADVLTKQDETIGEDRLVGSYVGVCKFFDSKKGFGFLKVIRHLPESGSCPDVDLNDKDVFVHHSGVKPSNSNFSVLTTGEYVSFNITHSEKGPQAVDVTGVFGGPLLCDNVMMQRAPSSFGYGQHPSPQMQQFNYQQPLTPFQMPEYPQSVYNEQGGRGRGNGMTRGRGNGRGGSNRTQQVVHRV